MEIPKPVDISALSGILAKSRQVMSKVETTNPSTPKNTRSIVEHAGYEYDESDEKEMVFEGYQPKPNEFDPTNIVDYTEEQVLNSNLPQNVKEAMIKNRIPRLISPPSKFSAEDISRITGAPIRKPEMIKENVQKQNSDMITISKSELKDMINEGIATFFKQVYDKTLTEETIKKTINMLIKEGKINVKRKTI